MKVKVQELMSKSVVTAQPHHSVAHIKEKLTSPHFSPGSREQAQDSCS